MNRPTSPMSRWRAAGIHVAISVVIGLAVLALLFGVWYPPPYFRAAGADELVLLLVGVDLTLGPLLTLIVFRSGKRGLTFDLAVIGLVQAGALVYGLSVVLASRPVFLVATVDHFSLVSAGDLAADDLAEGKKPEFRSLSWTGPRLVGIARPTDAHERSQLLFSGLNGKDIDRLPKYYVDYEDDAANVLEYAQPLDTLLPNDAAAQALVQRWLHQHGRESAGIVWLPITARRHDLTMLMDRSSGTPLGAIAVNAW